MSAGKSSTATGTTATAEPRAGLVRERGAPADHVGRFAPSPTGSLHLGSLTTAVASFVDARAHGGRWLVRIEDLDTPRVVPGKAAEILHALELHGLEWDGPVLHQNGRLEAYQSAYDRLRTDGLLYPCVCSRRALQAEDGVGEPYPGHCRGRSFEAFDGKLAGSAASRFQIARGTQVRWNDRFLGAQSFDLSAMSDFVVQRRDGIFAYHLAVVVDDAAQGVTSVVRGSDLLSSTPWQIALQRALGLPEPSYGHTPLLTEPGGAKLAKSRRSAALDPKAVSRQLTIALTVLGQDVPGELIDAPCREVLRHAVHHWEPAGFRGRSSAPVVENFVPGPALY